MLTYKQQNVHTTWAAMPLPVCHTKTEQNFALTYKQRKKHYCNLQVHDIQKRVFVQLFLNGPNKLRSVQVLLLIKRMVL